MKRLISFAILLLVAGAPRLQAQPVPFGSADDPAEQIRTAWWQPQNHVAVLGGLALIGPQWMGAAGVRAQFTGRTYALNLRKTIHGGYYTYQSDYDEYYDALRAVSFARYAPPGRSLYARIGPLQRFRLGVGHLVNFFNTNSSWVDRTVGGEAYLGGTLGNLALFTGDLRPTGVVGARFSSHPLRGAETPWLRTLSIDVEGVTDIGTWRDHGSKQLTAFQIGAQAAAVQAGTISLSPFISVSGYTDYGHGIMGGVDLKSKNFIDLARFRLRLGLDASGDGFLPGYIGPFYPVSNPRAHILNAVRFQSPDSLRRFVDVPLRRVRRNWGLTTELHLLFFQAFELTYAFRRHYGPQQLSTMHFRLFARAGEKFTLNVEMERAGLHGFFSPFSDLGDRSLLNFIVNYHLWDQWWVRIKSRYTFEPRSENEDGVQQYLVRRRFEPLLGFQYNF